MIQDLLYGVYIKLVHKKFQELLMELFYLEDYGLVCLVILELGQNFIFRNFYLLQGI